MINCLLLNVLFVASVRSPGWDGGGVKTVKKCLILFLSVLCLFCFCVSAASGDGNSGYQQAYIAMLEEFERGNYEDALTAAEIVYEANPGYQEIMSYYNYLNALLVYLPGGRYQEAVDVFDALALRSFQKSAGYKAYTLGCQYEAKGSYTEALDQFSQAFSLNVDEAYSKMQECRAKSKEEKYAHALDLQAQKKYLDAADAFDALVLDYPDARNKADECRYAAAEEYSREAKYAEAADLFARLGEYRDSAKKAAQNRAWASSGNTPKALGLKVLSTSADSLSLKWESGAVSGVFRVSWQPSGIDSRMQTKKVNGYSAVLSDLLPNTLYSVTVTSQANPTFSEVKSFWTDQAPPVTLFNFRGMLVRPYLLDRAAVSSAGVDHVINTAKGTDKCTDLGEGAYKVPRRKPGETGYDTYIYVSFFGDKFSRVQTLDFTFMLRLDEQSSVGKTEKVSLSVQGFKTFFTCITDLMDELYENTGLEGSELTLEVYVSGQYLGKQIIPLER